MPGVPADFCKRLLAGEPVCVMVGSAAEAKPVQALGATAFIVSTDQGFLRKAAAQALTEMAVLKS